VPVQIKVDIVSRENKAAMEALFKNSLRAPNAVDIGLFQGTTEKDGSPTAMIAATHEYGSPEKGIPERSFMRSAMHLGKDRINERLRKDIAALITGRGTKKMVLSRVGLLATNLIQARIRSSKSWAKPLAPITIARKGSTVPLIDTGRMLASITYRLEGEKPKAVEMPT